MNEREDVSRRDFLKRSAGVIVAAAGATAGVARSTITTVNGTSTTRMRS